MTPREIQHLLFAKRLRAIGNAALIFGMGGLFALAALELLGPR